MTSRPPHKLPTSPSLTSTASRLYKATMRHVRHTLLSALRSLLRRTKHIHAVLAAFLISLRPKHGIDPQRAAALAYTTDIEHLFGAILEHDALLALSTGLRNQYSDALRDNMACMLPSYNHLLPSGREKGIYVALDVGGSTFRVAVLELFGAGAVPTDEASRMKGLKTYKIDDSVKQLAGEKFFEWLAARIEDTLKEVQGLDISLHVEQMQRMDMGLSWSFPIEHTSLRSGRIQGMGKGFRAMEGLLGADLADVLQGACDRRGLPVTLTATVNDSASTLLSRAYNTPHTHYGLILGTGVNIAVHLPIPLVESKLASRDTTPPTTPPSLSVSPISSRSDASEPAERELTHRGADASHSHVIVNTEISMFGTGILPLTRFDLALDAAHPLPGFQPLEMLVSGRYLGEVARLVMVEGVQSHGLFGGKLPAGLETPYAFDTEVLAGIQAAEDVQAAMGVLVKWFPGAAGVGERDVECVRRIAGAVARRASAVVAGAIFALRGVRDGAEVETVSVLSLGNEAVKGADIVVGVVDAATDVLVEGETTVVACAGSVIEFYPGFREGVQERLDGLCGSGEGRGRIELAIARESSLLGAAVGAAVVAGAGVGGA